MRFSLEVVAVKKWGCLSVFACVVLGLWVVAVVLTPDRSVLPRERTAVSAMLQAGREKSLRNGESKAVGTLSKHTLPRAKNADPDVVRFVIAGDTGEGNALQYRVARGMQARCDRAGGCDAFLMLGDNIYQHGAQSANDIQFDEKIDQPYQKLKQGPKPPQGQPDRRARLPILVTLGNHDLGGAGLVQEQVAHYTAYARSHPWFVFPAEFYEMTVGHVHVVSLHTNPLALRGLQLREQAELVDRVVEHTPARWTIAIGHHPYRSNGRHGNAGSYEGIEGDAFYLGGAFREWVDEVLCNRVDFFFTGHDHNRQWLASVPNIPTYPPDLDPQTRRPCNTHFAVSGAGAKTRPIEDRGNDLAFGSDQPGFLFLEVHRDHVRAEFCDADGTPEWNQAFTR